MKAQVLHDFREDSGFCGGSELSKFFHSVEWWEHEENPRSGNNVVQSPHIFDDFVKRCIRNLENHGYDARAIAARWKAIMEWHDSEEDNCWRFLPPDLRGDVE